jgi:hypothetical protein
VKKISEVIEAENFIPFAAIVVIVVVCLLCVLFDTDTHLSKEERKRKNSK